MYKSTFLYNKQKLLAIVYIKKKLFIIIIKALDSFIDIKNEKKKMLTQLFINNEFVDALSGRTFPTYNPATEELLANVQEADKDDIDAAVAAARKAFEIGSEWRTMDATQRGNLINKLADLIERDSESLAKLETLNNGKCFVDSKGDIEAAIGCLRYYAGWSDKIFGKVIPAEGPYFTYTKHQPIGVCAQIIPW
jgi:acyl-CoA reductase-like NAD-dependent aldehyde dehydrogenase